MIKEKKENSLVRQLTELGRYEAMSHVGEIDLTRIQQVSSTASPEQEQEPAHNNLVESPSHYHSGTIEVIDAVEHWGLGFNLGNVIKYIARCQYKNDELTDLKKALWYLKREIETQEDRLKRYELN